MFNSAPIRTYGQYILGVVFSIAVFAPLSQANAEEGVTDTRILFGSSAPLTGDSAARGKEFIRGADLYLNKLNQSGGIFGRKIEMKIMDDGYDPKRTFENTSAMLTKDKVFALFLYFGTQGPIAVKNLVDQKEVPLLFPTSASTALRTPVIKNIFTLKSSALDEANTFVKYLVEKKGIKDIGLFYQNDIMGSSGMDALQRGLEKFNLKRHGEGSYVRGTTDVDAAIDALISSNPKAVILSSMANASAAFIKKAIARNFKPIFMIYSSASEPLLYEELAHVDAEIYVAQALPFVTSTPSMILSEYKAVDGEKANNVGFEGFLNSACLADALKIAGKDLTREKLRSALEHMKDFDLGGIKINLSATNHQGMVNASFFQYKNGKKLPVAL
jgi:branched-chain amino acid transport system substrate-binding protein